jgi:5-formyltetrahydrofolate cyclo-ligase
VVVCDDIIQQKQALRHEMKARRALMNESERARAAWSLSHHLSDWLEANAPASIGVYLARPYEISLDLVIEKLLREGVTVAAPRVDVGRGIMTFWRLESLDNVENGPWSVRQPPATQHLEIEELPLLLVPGLAFGLDGGRLGTGGGWYDRVLPRAQTTIGVGFDCQIIPQVPLEDHDCRVNFVASEARWLEVG